MRQVSHRCLLWSTFAVRFVFCGLMAGLVAGAAWGGTPFQLHPDNPHYFLWRGVPSILITSGEHYGAVLNQDFDYKAYLKTLESFGFNLTRTFSGAYCEHPGAFSIQDNTLAPKKDRLICPWARSDTPGYPNGGSKFDLTQWDPVYFKRLRDFLGEADKRGVVIELVLFCTFYGDEMWDLSPMNASNNVNGIGTMGREEVCTLKHPELLAVQDAMVRKVVEELKDIDNVYYEICNEPYFGGVTLEWQAHISQTIAEAEAKLNTKHLIAQNIANGGQKIANPDANVSLFNFHYADPPTTIADNWGLNRALGDDETGFDGDGPDSYRIEGWDFIVAGGATYSNLDYSFTCGTEDGSASPKAPGSRGRGIQEQLAILKKFISGLDFVHMKPDTAVIKKVAPEKTSARALAEPGKAYAVYVRGNGPATLTLDLPAGAYAAEWVDTKTGKVAGTESLKHDGGEKTLVSPPFALDIALSIKRAGTE